MPATLSKTGLTAAEIREDYLFGTILSVVKKSALSDRYLCNKIRGQEDALERELGILWQATRIRSEPDPGDTDFDLIEPAYDYTSDFFVGESWGSLKLRRAPVRSVQRLVFAYPNIDAKTFTVPSKWIRLDRDYGFIRLVPDGLAVMTSFSGYILSVLSGGRGIPQTINVDYTAGFGAGNLDVATTLTSHYMDYLEHLKFSVVADIIRDSMLPQSGSINADGLSRSISLDFKNVLEQQKEQRKMLKDRIKGPAFTVV